MSLGNAFSEPFLSINLVFVCCQREKLYKEKCLNNDLCLHVPVGGLFVVNDFFGFACSLAKMLKCCLGIKSSLSSYSVADNAAIDRRRVVDGRFWAPWTTSVVTVSSQSASAYSRTMFNFRCMQALECRGYRSPYVDFKSLYHLGYPFLAPRSRSLKYSSSLLSSSILFLSRSFATRFHSSHSFPISPSTLLITVALAISP